MCLSSWLSSSVTHEKCPYLELTGNMERAHLFDKLYDYEMKLWMIYTVSALETAQNLWLSTQKNLQFTLCYYFAGFYGYKAKVLFFPARSDLLGLQTLLNLSFLNFLWPGFLVTITQSKMKQWSIFCHYFNLSTAYLKYQFSLFSNYYYADALHVCSSDNLIIYRYVQHHTFSP